MPRTPIHPGEILADELTELGLSAARLADTIEVPPNRISQIIAGKRAITADTALRLARVFGVEAQFWMNLQQIYELDLARLKLKADALKRIPALSRDGESRIVRIPGRAGRRGATASARSQ
jgi:addiction module HigA family antidote